MQRLIASLKIMGHTLASQAQTERAYLGDFWLKLLSSMTYNIMFVLFVDFLFQRVGSIAGYVKNDFLFMIFVSQIGFYFVYYCLFEPLRILIERVRRGDLDLILLKPVPTRTFMYVSAIKPLVMLITTIPNFFLIGLLINWQELSLSPHSVALGIVVAIAGIVIFNTLLFALAWPVFKQGDASNMMDTFYALTAIKHVPYGKLPLFMQIMSLTLLPALLQAAGVAAVMLQKSDPMPIVVSSIVASVVAVGILQFMWRSALRNYTSASS